MIELNLKAKPTNLFPVCFDNFVYMMEKVGSRAICVPAPTNTDDDRLIYVGNTVKLGKIVTELLKEGWVASDQYDLNEVFISFKKQGNDLNLILTADYKFYKRFKIAVKICKMKNVLDKQERIKIHDWIINME